jgi:hypothetical protein
LGESLYQAAVPTAHKAWLMMKYKKYFAVLLLLVLAAAALYAQKESVEFKTRAVTPLRKFQYHQPSNFEVVNGRFNAAIASSNGYLFEISGLPVKLLRCKNKIAARHFKAVLIDHSLDRTYVSRPTDNVSLQVRCLPNGDYELLYTGEAWREKQKVIITACMLGSVNHSKNIKEMRN